MAAGGFRDNHDDSLRELLVDASKGDVLAFEEFVRNTRAMVFSYVLGMVPRDMVEDVVQDIYLRLWRAKGSYNSDFDAKAFLFTLAYRSCTDALRSHSKQLRNIAAVATEAQGTGEIFPISQSDLAIDLTVLSKEQKEVLLLVGGEGFSYAEAAEILGIKVQTVKSRLHEARRLLQRSKENSRDSSRENLA
ncbi:Sigma-70 region 2 [Ferrithrix thermotolerans DSM 19514]|uniref:Sigma-70 region 2 n=1 Tax=Ferrithrix thermotolerans DSM 19514 TaxID=1121881 RepID=A0A1M4SD69_9ACTN|nr:RNA polymerase sigma factor [Ferrithrix thermotolerans]SHE30146.1 Sigma-70 region 2 [Ferrithrix thermotolerans DSM 19514]